VQNDRSGPDDGALADHLTGQSNRSDTYMSVITNHYVTSKQNSRREMNVIANMTVVFHNGTRIDDAVLPNHRTGVDNGSRHDHRTRRHNRRRRNDRARMNGNGWVKLVLGTHSEALGTNTIVANCDEKRSEALLSGAPKLSAPAEYLVAVEVVDSRVVQERDWREEPRQQGAIQHDFAVASSSPDE
jgi:hypothetical protein